MAVAVAVEGGDSVNKAVARAWVVARARAKAVVATG